MYIHYDWPEDAGETPDIGVWLDVQGDPDQPVLQGVVARVSEDEDGTLISILMADGQPGSEEFQHWVSVSGTVGVMVSASQVRPSSQAGLVQ